MTEYYPKKMRRILGHCKNPRHCKHSNQDITESTYRYKGCWGCEYFLEGDSFPYLSVKQVSKQLACSQSKVYSMIKEGELEGDQISQKRWTGFAPAPPKMHITKKSVEDFYTTFNLKKRR